MAKSQKQVKEVTIIARYQFKADPKKVVYLVRASNGVDTYQVFFYNGKACSCNCPARKPCYHMTQLELREQARGWQIPEGTSLVRDNDRSEEREAEPVSEQAPVAETEEIDEEAKVARWTAEELAKQNEARRVDRERRMASAPLNGNRAFSLMR